MAPHTINTIVADRQLGKCYFYKKQVVIRKILL